MTITVEYSSFVAPHVATFSLINPSPKLKAGPPLDRGKIAGRARRVAQRVSAKGMSTKRFTNVTFVLDARMITTWWIT